MIIAANLPSHCCNRINNNLSGDAFKILNVNTAERTTSRANPRHNKSKLSHNGTELDGIGTNESARERTKGSSFRCDLFASVVAENIIHPVNKSVCPRQTLQKASPKQSAFAVLVGFCCSGNKKSAASDSVVSFNFIKESSEPSSDEQWPRDLLICISLSLSFWSAPPFDGERRLGALLMYYVLIIFIYVGEICSSRYIVSCFIVRGEQRTPAQL